MGVDALPGWLAAAGVPAGTVRLGPDAGPADAVWCLRPAPDPEAGGAGWELFWSERGERYAWTWFDDEATACFALFGRLAWARLVQGALGPTR